MSHELHVLAVISGSSLALLLGLALVLIVVTSAVFVAFRRSRSAPPGPSSWQSASQELDIDLLFDVSTLGPVATGAVNNHVVSIAPFTSTGFFEDAQTMYTVNYESPEAPAFSLTGRTAESHVSTLDTGNPKFDAVVAVSTEHPALLSRFLTPARRGAILRLLTYWPEVVITNRTTRVLTAGIESDSGQLVDSVCHLVAAAEIFDQRSAPSASNAAADQPTKSRLLSNAGNEDHVDPRDVRIDLRVDEVSVFRDLFATKLDSAGIADKFDQLYRGREVTWSGEVVRVSAFDDSQTQRIAAFVGSASGRDPASGRVVVITTVPVEPRLSQGDVVTFTGTLANLDVAQRLFHLT